MKRHIITKPVGLDAFCNEIEAVCSEAHIYNQGRLRPPHLIVSLDSGSGRTTCIEYMTDMYKEHHVIKFNGLDDYIEIQLDGTPQQLKRAFVSIDRAADYTNEYTNIVGMDISNIACHLNETQFTDFISSIKKVCESACVVFFVHSNPSKNEEKLIEKLCSNVSKIKRIDVEPYTYENICDLIVRLIADRDTLLSNARNMSSLLMNTVKEFDICTVQEAIDMVDELIHYADYSSYMPEINEKSIKSLIENWSKSTERSEVR
ncbi:MAG: hypothetical protein K6A72_03610 [Lachnospiraceae bacterium]|nr:hypothetical protein [Lachnospiraceae bacterium]